MTGEKTYHAGPVRITKHQVSWRDSSWDDLADLTLNRLTTSATHEGLHYFNPEYSLYAPAGTPEECFVRQARRVQILWNKRLARVFGAGVRRRAIKAEEPDRRVLIFTGILIIGGKPFHPKGWPGAFRTPTAGK